jgi:cyclic-di-GMP phosphodiesterase TipF (flagellum assembly factor)
MHLGGMFVAVCMLLIAGSAGATAYLGLGLPLAGSILIAISILVALVLYNAVSARLGVRAAVGSQLAEFSRGNADMARQLAELGRRLATMEGGIVGAADKSRAVTDPLAIEIGELGTLVKQLAETVAAHETALAGLARRLARDGNGADVPGGLPSEPMAPTVAPATPVPETVPALVGQDDPPHTLRALIEDAIDANRVDLYLQPIVTLPQRKVRYYEAVSRLRTDAGDLVQANQFVPQAERFGLMPKIDNLVLFRCVQVIRRLLLKNRDVGLFCNVSGSTLTDAGVFQQLLDFLDANRAIAPSIVLEFTQSALRAAGPIENEGLSALADRGYRFSLDNVQDLRLEPRELASRGFRFVKVPAGLLLDRGEAATDIHPADLSDLLGRFGIDLIAEKIEGESVVVNLLDYDVRFGQGFLFSPPRPVRAEALQGIADRNDVVAREDAFTSETTPAAVRPQQPGDKLPAVDTAAGQRPSGLAQLARRV